jgi:hypothetical protein
LRRGGGDLPARYPDARRIIVVDGACFDVPVPGIDDIRVFETRIGDKIVCEFNGSLFQ